MVQPVTNDQQAHVTAQTIRKFAERRRLLRLEEVCLSALIEELTEALLQYRRQQEGVDP